MNAHFNLLINYHSIYDLLCDCSTHIHTHTTTHTFTSWSVYVDIYLE